MDYSCGNCKHMKCYPDRLYPYKCDLNKAVSFGRANIEQRIRDGFKCEKYVFGINKPIKDGE